MGAPFDRYLEQHTVPVAAVYTTKISGKRHARVRWTAALVGWLTGAVHADATGTDIAQAINQAYAGTGATVSRSAVIGRVYRAGIRPPVAARPRRPKKVAITPPRPVRRGNPLSLSALGPHQCRYPQGEGSAKDPAGWDFCGAPIAAPGTAAPPYCLAHLRVCVPAAYDRLVGGSHDARAAA